MENGYRSTLAKRELRITIVDGKAYDQEMYAFPCGQPLFNARLQLDAYGNVSAYGAVWEFLPDDGEIERVGGTSFFLEGRLNGG
jgi:hypothetical protein